MRAGDMVLMNFPAANRDPHALTVCNVSDTIASIVDAGISGLRPRPGAITPTAATHRPDSGRAATDH
jgi:hypothetical protein